MMASESCLAFDPVNLETCWLFLKMMKSGGLRGIVSIAHRTVRVAGKVCSLCGAIALCNFHLLLDVDLCEGDVPRA